MSRASPGEAPLGRARAELAERLRARRGEIEAATLTRVYAISDPTEASDPTYADGLRAAVSAALDYGLDAIDLGDTRPQPVPLVLLAQARFAARNNVSLDTVMRRYFAGYALLGDFVIEEAASGTPLGESALKRALRAQAIHFDRLLAAVAEEHVREGQGRPESAEERRGEIVRGLLDGELLEPAELAYDLDANHLGVVASGPGASEAIRDMAAALDRRLLMVRARGDTLWAWLGGRRAPDVKTLTGLLAAWPEQVALALGEPAPGIAGWRLTHRQAAAALPVAQRSGGEPIRYAEVALLASALNDGLLATSLREIYVKPLELDPDGGVAAKLTLRAYLAAARNVSSAAAALGVSRGTVTSRLRAAEELLGRSLDDAAAELEIALRLDALDEA